MKKIRILTLAILSLGMVGCGNKETPVETSSIPESTEKITYTLDVIVKGDYQVGNNLILIAQVNKVTLPNQADVTYTCSDADAVTIDGNEIELNKVGEYTIIASYSKDGAVVATKEIPFTVTENDATVKKAMEAAVDTEVTVQGVVTAFVGGVYSDAYSAQGFYLSDNTGTAYVFGSKVANQVHRGDKIKITGKRAEHSGSQQIASPNLVETIASNQEAPDPSEYVIKGKTVTDIYQSTENIAGNTYKLDCQIEKYPKTPGSYLNYEIIDSKGTYINIYSSASNLFCPENAWLDEYIGKDITVAFYVNSKSSKGKWRGNIVYIYPEAA